MRYFTAIVSEKEVVDGSDLILSYKKQLRDLLKIDVQGMDFEKFVRLSNLFKKLEELEDNAILEIEDQDYKLIEQKLEVYLTKAPAVIATSKNFMDFIKYLKDLPTVKRSIPKGE